MPDLQAQVSLFDHHGYKDMDIPPSSGTVVKLSKVPTPTVGQYSGAARMHMSKVGSRKRQITSNIKQLYSLPKGKGSKKPQRGTDTEIAKTKCKPNLKNCSPTLCLDNQVQPDLESDRNTREEFSQQIERRTKAKVLAKLRSSGSCSDDNSSNRNTTSNLDMTNPSSHVVVGHTSKDCVEKGREATLGNVLDASKKKKKSRFRKAKLPLKSPLTKTDNEQQIKPEAQGIQKAYGREEIGEMKSSDGNRVSVAASKAYQDFVSGLYEPNVQEHVKRQKREASSAPTSCISECETPATAKKPRMSGKCDINSDRKLRTQTERKFKSLGPDMYYIDDGDVIRRSLSHDLNYNNSEGKNNKTKQKLQVGRNCDKVKRNLRKSFDTLGYGSELNDEVSKQRKSRATKFSSKMSERKNTSAYQMKTARIVLEKLDVVKWKSKSVRQLQFTSTNDNSKERASDGNAIIGVISKGLDSSLTAEDESDTSNLEINILKKELPLHSTEAPFSCSKSTLKTSPQAANARKADSSIVQEEIPEKGNKGEKSNDNVELQTCETSPEFEHFVTDKYRTSTPKDKSREMMFQNRVSLYAKKATTETTGSQKNNTSLKEIDELSKQNENDKHFTTPDASQNGMNMFDSDEKLHLELEETPDCLSSIRIKQAQSPSTVDTHDIPVKESERIHPIMDMESQSDSEICNQTVDAKTVPNRPSSVSLDQTDIKKRPVSTCSSYYPLEPPALAEEVIEEPIGLDYLYTKSYLLSV